MFLITDVDDTIVEVRGRAAREQQGDNTQGSLLGTRHQVPPLYLQVTQCTVT